MGKKIPVLDAFERHYIPEPNSGCWLWMGASLTQSSNGVQRYGCFRREGKSWGAHVYSYKLFKGPIPRGAIVRHICDVSWCVNPDHLLLGTHRDNAADREQRGRSKPKRGSLNPAAILTEQQVCFIKRALQQGHSQYEIADKYNVWQSTISAIKRGLIWSHVDG